DGVGDTAALTVTLGRPLSVQILLEQSGAVVGAIFSGPLGAGVRSLGWNGTVNGAPVADGTYEAVVTASDPLGSIRLASPVTVDTTPPVLTPLDPAALRFQLSEPARVTATVDGQTVVLSEPEGSFT